MQIPAQSFLSIIPTLLLLTIWAAAVLLAALHWSRSPRVSVLVILSMSILFISLLFGWSLSSLLPMLSPTLETLHISQGTAIYLYSALSTLLNAAAWALIIAAVFVGRKPKS